MSAIPAIAILQAEAASPDFSFLLMMGMIGLIFYFLVFRPQNKKQRDLEQSIKAAQKGDSVITAGGLHGRVHAAAENVLTVEIGTVKGAPVRVEIERARIERVVKADEAKAAEAEAAAEKGKKHSKDKGGDES